MEEYEIRGAYISYLIGQTPSTDDDLPGERTLEYEEFCDLMENGGIG